MRNLSRIIYQNEASNESTIRDAILLSFLHQIMKNHLHLHHYKLQLAKKIKAGDHGKYSQLMDWFHRMQDDDTDFESKITFSNEVNFYVSRIVR